MIKKEEFIWKIDRKRKLKRKGFLLTRIKMRRILLIFNKIK